MTVRVTDVVAVVHGSDAARAELERARRHVDELSARVLPKPDPAESLKGFVDAEVRFEAIRRLPGYVRTARDFDQQMARLDAALSEEEE